MSMDYLSPFFAVRVPSSVAPSLPPSLLLSLSFLLRSADNSNMQPVLHPLMTALDMVFEALEKVLLLLSPLSIRGNCIQS